jgi:hypothetical protein
VADDMNVPTQPAQSSDIWQVGPVTDTTQPTLFDDADRHECPSCHLVWSGPRPKHRTYWWMHRDTCYGCAGKDVA